MIRQAAGLAGAAGRKASAPKTIGQYKSCPLENDKTFFRGLFGFVHD